MTEGMLNGPRYYWQGPDERWYAAAGWRPFYTTAVSPYDVPKGVAVCVVLSPGHYLAVLDERRGE